MDEPCTQSAIVLTARHWTLDEVAQALASFPMERVDLGSSAPWRLGGPCLIWRVWGENGRAVVVDVHHSPWPDGMGDPGAAADLFAAWDAGYFGSATEPGALARAAQQSWECPELEGAAVTHVGFVRLLVVSLDEARPEAEPLREVETLTRLASELLKHAGALAYFNPGGESLRDQAFLEDSLAAAKEEGVAPLEIWVNIRLHELLDVPGWTMMDTVGMRQFDLEDHEACFETGAQDYDDVDFLLRLATGYVFQRRESSIDDGATLEDGAGAQWQVAFISEGLAPPPRPVLRWFPLKDADKRPAVLLQDPADEAGD